MQTNQRYLTAAIYAALSGILPFTAIPYIQHLLLCKNDPYCTSWGSSLTITTLLLVIGINLFFFPKIRSKNKINQIRAIIQAIIISIASVAVILETQHYAVFKDNILKISYSGISSHEIYISQFNNLKVEYQQTKHGCIAKESLVTRSLETYQLDDFGLGDRSLYNYLRNIIRLPVTKTRDHPSCDKFIKTSYQYKY